MQEEIKHINEKNQEYIAEGNRMTKEINKGCEFQSDCIEYKDISYLKIMPICAIHELSIACHDKENKCKYYKLYTQLTRLEQENKELKAYKDINEDFKKAWGELNEKHKHLRSTLEEIQELSNINKEWAVFMKPVDRLEKINKIVCEALQ